MPELPEVEVVRAGLAAHVLGARIADIEVLDPRSLRRHDTGPGDFRARLSGARIDDVARRGKYLWLLLADPRGHRLDDALVVHLGMSGQALLARPDAPAPRHLRLRFDLLNAGESFPDGRGQLRFVDQRIFGGMFLDRLLPVHDAAGSPVPGAGASELGEASIPASVAHIARDPLDPHFDARAFRRRLLRTDSGIKRVLLDQTAISGVGNIYADEALWRTRLHYAKPARSLTAAQTRDLLGAVTEVMTEALAEGGTSFDALYVNVNGESGYFARGLNVYGREGLACRRCGRSIRREPFMNRSSYRCPRCQRAPRAL